MEGVEMAAAALSMEQPQDDFCFALLSQFSNSTNEHHLHVCAAIGAMSQELKDQNFPLTPTAYFGATCSSLDRLTSSADPPGHLLDALLTILSRVFDNVSPAILKTKYVYVSELLIRTHNVKSIGVHGVVHGLKCASRMLIVRENVLWEDVTQLFGFLISYITDDRAKVRKQARSFLHDVIESFLLQPVLALLLAPASEAISNVFERCLLLAGGSTPNASGDPERALKVLYILDALGTFLPYMSSKSLTSILKRFKFLLELKQSIVTRHVTDALNALCLRSNGEIPPEVLLDVLCSLANSVSSDDADSITLTARLLDTGMKRVFSLNRLICTDKLPFIFNVLKDILCSGHEEALLAAVSTFKSLIKSCIDQSLIEQGVDCVTGNADSATMKTGPTVIVKVCATIESLLDYHYEAVWDTSFQIVSTMFEKLGKYSFYLMKGTLKNLADMQKLLDGDFSFKKQLHECIGVALAAMGPENFLCLLPLNLEVEDLSEANLWLFPILKQYTVCAHLSFFTNSILPMIFSMRRKSTLREQEKNLQLSRSVDGIIYSLWSLLPSFCNYPVDTAESFKGLEAALCTALQEEPDIRGIICSSLQILVQQNKRILEGKEDSPKVETGLLEQRALYHVDVARTNLSTLKSSTRKLFSVLVRVYFKSSKDTGGILQSTIAEFASISDKEVVSEFFKKIMQKLLKKIKEANESRNTGTGDFMQVDNSSHEVSSSTERAALFDIAVSLLPGLTSKEIDLLFIAVQIALKDTDGLIQKKAYRVLSLLFQNANDFISKKLEAVINLMIEVLPSYQLSAKRYRLDCLYFLIICALKEGVPEQSRHNITASFLTEIILALKEANKKTRNRAYDILVQIGYACEVGEGDAKNEKLQQFFNMVARGLASDTPHMISAAMTGLARLAYEFSDLVSSAYNVLPSAFLLLQRKNKEIMKANLGLLKVLVAKSQAESLQTHLKSMVEGLLIRQDSTRNYFKAKVKLLLEMLIKKCGLDAVREVMPAEHIKLLTNIRKLKERSEKKHAAKSLDERSILSTATTSRMSKWNHTKIFSDFEDDSDVNEHSVVSGRQSKYSSSTLQSKASLLRSKRTRKAAKSLQEDAFEKLDDEPLDLLDIQKTRSVLRSTRVVKRKSDSDDDEPDIDSEGRIIIHEHHGKKGKRLDRKQKGDVLSDIETDGKSEAGSHLSASSRITQKRRKTSETGWAYTGKEYASRKAGGDVRRKDKLEPYAYWPLDRKMLSRRPEHRAAARKGMIRIGKLTKNLEGRSVKNALSVKGLESKKIKKKGYHTKS